MKVLVIKSKESVNGGFVNTVTVEAVQQSVFGKSIVKQRYLTKTADAIIEDGDDALDITDKFDMSMFTVNIIPSKIVNESTGEVTTIENKWLIANL